MARKFKFKPSSTGDLIAVEAADDKIWYFELYHGYSHIGTVPPVVVLNSNDWEEITEKPILETQDNFAKYEGDVLYVAHSEDWSISKVCCSSELTTQAESEVYFHSIENAKAYIERHKPRYSNEDLDYIREVVDEDIDYYVNEHELKGSIMTAIDKLKNSKND